MSVDYRDQYTPRQLEPFWPNEIVRMVVVVLCTLTVIMGLVTLPTVLEWAHLGGLVHEEEPANPHVTPEHIKPEWYFLATYEYLKLMEYPQRWFGIDGKMLGVISQGPVALIVLTLPFWYRRRANQPPGWIYYVVLTLGVAVFLILTLAAIWPPNGLFLSLTLAAILLFYILMYRERRAVRKLLSEEETEREPPP